MPKTAGSLQNELRDKTHPKGIYTVILEWHRVTQWQRRKLGTGMISTSWCYGMHVLMFASDR